MEIMIKCISKKEKKFLYINFYVIIILSVFMKSIINSIDYMIRAEPKIYTEKHKKKWIDYLEGNNDAFALLERLYNIDDDLLIRNINNKLYSNVILDDMFSHDELVKLEKIACELQWETIRFKSFIKTDYKVMEIISFQLIFGKYFQKYYCSAAIIYSPYDRLINENFEEIFCNWFYRTYFET